jgi:hypothetical protein
MTREIRTFTGFTAAFAVAAALAAAPPAQSLPIDLRSPDAREAGAAQQAFGGSYRPIFPKNGMDHRAIEAALAQEEYYSSHKPADAESGLARETRYSGRDLRTVDVRDAAAAPGGSVRRVAAPLVARSTDSGGFEWDDAAIGAGSALGLVLVLAGGAAAVSRRRTPATP